MTSNHNQQDSPRRHASLMRALAFLLLLLISYSATAGATHRHGNLLKRTGVAETAASITDAGTQGSNTGETSTSGECLMCRLHQHLFAGLLHHLPGFITPSVKLACATVNRVSYFSRTNAPRLGRAPPSFSLL